MQMSCKNDRSSVQRVPEERTDAKRCNVAGVVRPVMSGRLFGLFEFDRIPIRVYTCGICRRDVNARSPAGSRIARYGEGPGIMYKRERRERDKRKRRTRRRPSLRKTGRVVVSLSLCFNDTIEIGRSSDGRTASTRYRRAFSNSWRRNRC